MRFHSFKKTPSSHPLHSPFSSAEFEPSFQNNYGTHTDASISQHNKPNIRDLESGHNNNQSATIPFDDLTQPNGSNHWGRIPSTTTTPKNTNPNHPTAFPPYSSAPFPPPNQNNSFSEWLPHPDGDCIYPVQTDELPFPPSFEPEFIFGANEEKPTSSKIQPHFDGFKPITTLRSRDQHISLSSMEYIVQANDLQPNIFYGPLSPSSTYIEAMQERDVFTPGMEFQFRLKMVLVLPLRDLTLNPTNSSSPNASANHPDAPPSVPRITNNRLPPQAMKILTWNCRGEELINQSL